MMKVLRNRFTYSLLLALWGIIANGQAQVLQEETFSLEEEELFDFFDPFDDISPIEPDALESGAVRSHFMDPQRFNAVKSFYDRHYIKYFDARYDYYKNNGIMKEWRPW